MFEEDQSIFLALKSGQLEAFDRIYDLYRGEFLRTARFKFSSVPEEDIIDAWQDTVISFFEQVRSGKLQHLSCSLRSFLFLLGFRYIIKYKRRQTKEAITDVFDENIPADPEGIEEMLEVNLDLNKHMLNAVEQLPVQSRKILMLRYLEGKSIEEIMTLMNYTSANAVSVTLSRNLKKLRELLEFKRTNQ